MATATGSRSAIDPISPEDRDGISRLSRVIDDGEPSKAALVSSAGETVELPDEVYRVLQIVVSEMKAGHSITIVPHSQRISTQEAAELLGLSRPTLIKLLETGEIPFEQPGRHRRVLLTDVLAYRETRHQEARVTLDELTAEASSSGLYDASVGDYADAIRTARAARRGRRK